MSHEKRIAELEIRLAYQARLCAELDGVVREFAERVELLEARLRQLKEDANQEPIGPAHDPPPHY